MDILPSKEMSDAIVLYSLDRVGWQVSFSLSLSLGLFSSSSLADSFLAPLVFRLFLTPLAHLITFSPNSTAPSTLVPSSPNVPNSTPGANNEVDLSIRRGWLCTLRFCVSESST